ncbi:helix-turn-helix domain-containing protein [Mycobacterium kiyosense]|uniref:helix-turn-helix domain-containing protein n=1 Tax=Mycobacterium kiyosense TaxID=2871094 RepID=UPI002232BE69|nr:helix-turn-helix domain-containing protein [Mycobacterium kiyosense]
MCTRPWAARLAAADHERRRQQEPAAAAVAAIVLELGEAPYAGVPCWSGRLERWATWTVPVAYDCRYATQVCPLMPGNPISRRALLAVAQARARYADHATGRNCRPTNERLAADTGYSVRTIQRADTVLRLLGVATEVLRGRQRTRVERLASWRVGDRGRGWASVWALHDHRQLARLVQRLSPHPRSGPVREQSSGPEVVTTRSGSPAGRRQRGATRRRAPDAGGAGLARAWRADPHAPLWACRHTATAWAALLAGPAGYGWSPRDLNQLITDWAAVTGRRIPDHPHKPIGLLGAMLAWHGRDNLAERPAALDEAREAAELAAHHAHLAAQRAAHAEHQRAREAGRRALHSVGHAAARAAAAEAARRAAHKRTHAVAEDAAHVAAAVAAARTQ